MCMYVCGVCTLCCAGTHAQSLEVNVGCSHQFLFYSLFETGSLPEPGAHLLAGLAARKLQVYVSV